MITAQADKDHVKPARVNQRSPAFVDMHETQYNPPDNFVPMSSATFFFLLASAQKSTRCALQFYGFPTSFTLCLLNRFQLPIPHLQRARNTRIVSLSVITRLNIPILGLPRAVEDRSMFKSILGYRILQILWITIQNSSRLAEASAMTPRSASRALSRFDAPSHHKTVCSALFRKNCSGSYLLIVALPSPEKHSHPCEHLRSHATCTG